MLLLYYLLNTDTWSWIHTRYLILNTWYWH